MSAESIADLGAAAQALRQLFLELGFSRTDGDVYVELLAGEDITFQQLLRRTRFAPEEVRQSTARLRMLYLVNEVILDGKARLRVVDPKLAWTAYRYDDNWRAAADLVSRQAPQQGGTGTPTARALIADRIGEAACRLYAGKRRHVPLYRRVYDSADDFALVCSRTVMEAKHRVVAAEREPRLPQVALFWPSIVDITMRGIQYTRYATIDEVFLHGIDIVARDVETIGVDLQIVPRAAIQSSLYLVDDETLFLYANATEGVPFSARVSRNPGLINRYVTEKLGRLSAQATPFFDVKDAASRSIANKRDIVRSIGSSVGTFERIARLGKFAHLTAADRVSATEMHKAGILDRVDGGYAVAVAGDPYLESLL